MTIERPPNPRDLAMDEARRLEMDYIGKTARVDIPLRSVTALRKIAEELRGLAAHLDVLSRRTGELAAPVLFEARAECRRANKRLAVVRGRGRPLGGSFYILCEFDSKMPY